MNDRHDETPLERDRETRPAQKPERQIPVVLILPPISVVSDDATRMMALGFVEDLTIGLSRFRQFAVVAAHSGASVAFGSGNLQEAMALLDVDYAVAETGTLAICHRPGHGRAISLVPFVHVAIVEPKNFIPDMLDLFEKLPQQDSKSVTLISGPSKTADIEMNVVTGVHGPNVVQAFILQ